MATPREVGGGTPRKYLNNVGVQTHVTLASHASHARDGCGRPSGARGPAAAFRTSKSRLF